MTLSNGTPVANHNRECIQVAVIGGGIGGLCLALGLQKYSHLDVHIYEAAPAIHEIGAGVTLAPNATNALELISPQVKARLKGHATTNMWPKYQNTWADYKMGFGPNEGQLLYLLEGPDVFQSFHRAFLVEELAAGLPAQNLHFSKNLTRLEELDGSVNLCFEDGTNVTANAVIGADGIHSSVRDYTSGDTPIKPAYTGMAVYRGTVTMDKAVDKLGEEFAQNAHILCGPGGGFINYPIDKGRLVTISSIDLSHETWPYEKWTNPTKIGKLEEKYKTWGNIAQGLVQLLDQPSLSAWSLWDLASTPTYAKGHVAIMGDAAHATTPFLAQGAAQAIEDAAVLQALFGEVHDASEIPYALRAFDEVRRPRSQRIVTASRESARLTDIKPESSDEQARLLKEFQENTMDWAWNVDIVAQNAAAVERFEKSLSTKAREQKHPTAKRV